MISAAWVESAGKVPLRPIALTAIASCSAPGYATGPRPSLPAAQMTSVPWARASPIAERVASSRSGPPRLMFTRSQPSATARSSAFRIA